MGVQTTRANHDKADEPFENSLLPTQISLWWPNSSITVCGYSLSLSLQNRTRSRPRLDTYTPIKRIPVYYGAHFANLMAGVPTGHTRGDKGKREVVTSRGRDRLTVRTSF